MGNADRDRSSCNAWFPVEPVEDSFCSVSKAMNPKTFSARGQAVEGFQVSELRLEGSSGAVCS